MRRSPPALHSFDLYKGDQRHAFLRHSCLDTNDTTGRSWTGISSLLALLVASLSEVISASVDDDGAAEHTLWSDQLDELVGDGTLCVALTISLEVAQVSNVTV